MKDEDIIRFFLKHKTFLGYGDVDVYYRKEKEHWSIENREINPDGNIKILNSVVVVDDLYFDDLPELYFNLRQISKKLATGYLLYYVLYKIYRDNEPGQVFLVKKWKKEGNNFYFVLIKDGRELLDKFEGVNFETI